MLSNGACQASSGYTVLLEFLSALFLYFCCQALFGQPNFVRFPIFQRFSSNTNTLNTCIVDQSRLPLWGEMQTQLTSDDHCRLKCWECGVKKKAPCGQTQRDDLPWCCHRRLGEWIALHTVTRADNAQKSITFQSKRLLPFLRH